MTLTRRRMRLTPELVARVSRQVADPGPMPDQIEPSEQQVAATVHAIISEAASSEAIWFFAFGSLIWKPACDVVERRVALARGWHRAFCFGWDTRYRGNKDAPGLMLSLDRGGTCKGVAFRLPSDAIESNLEKLVRREPPFPPRWLDLKTEEGPIRAFAFVIDRKNGRYVSGLSEEAVADALAKAVGMWGSMAEYLHSTVEHLEDLGIHDKQLWRLQEMVAERIEAANMGADH
jgi:glutathione-specific gamma-glutamylcyclotransferase